MMDSILTSSTVSLLTNATTAVPSGWLIFLQSIAQAILPTTLVPRFFLNLREVYARDLQGRRGSNIDTGFGLGSGFEQGAVRSAIVFAGPRQNESEEGGDGMEMEIQEVGRTNGLA